MMIGFSDSVRPVGFEAVVIVRPVELLNPLILFTLRVPVAVDPCPTVKRVCGADSAKSPTGDVVFGLNRLVSCGPAAIAPTTEPTAKIPTRIRDHAGTPFLMKEVVDAD
jgi:hypothetical protein